MEYIAVSSEDLFFMICGGGSLVLQLVIGIG